MIDLSITIMIIFIVCILFKSKHFIFICSIFFIVKKFHKKSTSLHSFPFGKIKKESFRYLNVPAFDYILISRYCLLALLLLCASVISFWRRVRAFYWIKFSCTSKRNAQQQWPKKMEKPFELCAALRLWLVSTNTHTQIVPNLRKITNWLTAKTTETKPIHCQWLFSNDNKTQRYHWIMCHGILEPNRVCRPRALSLSFCSEIDACLLALRWLCSVLFWLAFVTVKNAIVGLKLYRYSHNPIRTNRYDLSKTINKSCTIHSNLFVCPSLPPSSKSICISYWNWASGRVRKTSFYQWQLIVLVNWKSSIIFPQPQID